MMRVAQLDVVVVGAGPAGIGMGLVLEQLGLERSLLIERGRIGESFRRWPLQTRFITPSFHSNPFGLADLNAVSANSSPALACGSEHPSGAAYADYLEDLVRQHALRILTNCAVRSVHVLPGGGFLLQTAQGHVQCRALIWATGEFQFPALAPFPGAESCLHYAQVSDWTALAAPALGPGQQRVVIGGYESGVDAAVNLAAQGQPVLLLARKSTWALDGEPDPSLSLSPYSRERLLAARASGALQVAFGASVCAVEADAGGQGWWVQAEDGRSWLSAARPVLGTGFVPGGGAGQLGDLFERDAQGRIVLTAQDESTCTPGLFLVGPQVRHDSRIYCFIYKFRQRFAGVGQAVAARLGRATAVDVSGEGAWGPFGNSECCEGCAC